MKPRTFARFVIYAGIGMVILAIIFVALLVIALMLFGVALVRADLFGVAATAYWVIVTPLAVFGAYRMATKLADVEPVNSSD